MRKRIVVTGLGAITPLGNDMNTTWEACRAGKSGVTRVTRFDPEAYDLRSHIAGEVKDFQLPAVIPAKEAKKMDVFIHYTVAATDEALKDSGLEITEELQPMIGISLGVGIGGQVSIEKYYNILQKDGAKRISPFFIPMALINMAGGFLSMLFKTRGYNATTVSACASSNHAIGDAARIIERGDATAMIVGGTEAAVTPLCLGGFAAMRALSTRNDDPARASRPYDQGRDGFVFAEGSTILILEEYEHALKRGARIYAEVKGYGFSSDAHHISAPNVEGPSNSMKMALRDAQVNADQVDYLNAHATSTPVGDVNEIKAIKHALGEDNAKKISISAPKSMTGHLLGAAGAFESALTCKSIYHDFVTPSINIENLDPEVDLDVTPNQGRERKINVAISNSFGFGGTNATLVFAKV